MRPPRKSPVPPKANTSSTTAAESLGLDTFAEPDDQGLSLDELSQAYAALVRKGADPYLEQPPSAVDPIAAVDLPAPDTPAAAESHSEDACEISPQTILEAMLFVGHPSGEPLTSERVAGLMRGVRPAEIDDYVSDLNQQYLAAGAPYSIVSEGPGYKISLRPEFASLRDVFYGRIREARLSQPAIDVLAVVAYHQPIPLVEIDRIRGKASGTIVSQLLRRDLLEVDRPGEDRAKPRYRTSPRFLELFGLSGIEELPRSETF